MLQDSLTNRQKRKVPEPSSVLSSYVAPIVYNRSINHQHTNSLPVDTGPNPIQHPNLTGSINNLNNYPENQYHTPSKNYETNYASPNQNQIRMSQEFGGSGSHLKKEPNHNKGSAQKILNKFHQNQHHHVKTFSLPVDMGPNNNGNNNHDEYNYNQNLNIPNRGLCSVEVPLPAGWSSEKSANGQTYYINHLTQTTTWDDPRLSYNQGNQNETNQDIRSLTKGMPMPEGWQENKSANGEIYYINHASQSTQWEDPRFEIYMRQEATKRTAYRSQYKENNFHSSSSSLSSSIDSSASSSIQSLNINSSNSSYPINQNSQRLPLKTIQDNNSISNKDHIHNLQQNLDNVLKQKNHILKEIEDLSQKETNLKSKLSQKNLDDVLFMLKNRNSKMQGFDRYDNQGKKPNEIKNESEIKSEPRQF